MNSHENMSMLNSHEKTVFQLQMIDEDENKVKTNVCSFVEQPVF